MNTPAGAALASIPRVQFLVAEMALELNSARAYLGETIAKLLPAIRQRCWTFWA